MKWARPTLFASLLVGCAEPTVGRDLGPGAEEPRSPVAFETCEDAEAPPAKSVSRFRHLSSKVITFASPWHSGDDVVTTDEAGATLRAKLAYGSLSKDLEDEWVEVWIDCCDELELVGHALTDDDGRVALALDPDELPGIGRFRIHFRVEGDGTGTSATLWVLPPGTRLAVFDIDGTLTTSDWELFEDLLDDLFVPLLHGDAPKARAGAAEITHARDEQGFVPLFLTGRPYWLTARSRDWLDARGMATGPLVTARRTSQILPTQSGVGTFKAETLAELELLGLDVELAYGNASTDIFAYGEAGIDPATTFIVGKHGGEQGTVDLGEDYEAHLAETDFDPIAQPFARP